MTKAWKEHQETITRLYISESRTLDEVREIMQNEHNFKASTRSYRQHFDQWNLGKYNCKKRTARRQQKHLVRMTTTRPSSLSPLAAAAAVFAVAGADRYDDRRGDPLSPESLGPDQHTHTHHHHHHHHQDEDDEEEEEGYSIKAEMMTAAAIRRDEGQGQYIYDQGLPSSYPPYDAHQRQYGRPRVWGALPSPPADYEYFHMTSPGAAAAGAGMEMVAASPRQEGYHHVLQQEQRVGRMFPAPAPAGEEQQQQRVGRMFPAPEQQRYAAAAAYHHPVQCRYRAFEADEPSTPRVWAV